MGFQSLYKQEKYGKSRKNPTSGFCAEKAETSAKVACRSPLNMRTREHLFVKNLRKFLQSNFLGALELQPVTEGESGSEGEKGRNSSPTPQQRKRSLQKRHIHINLEIKVSGVANPVLVCLVHKCTKSHLIKRGVFSLLSSW